MKKLIYIITPVLLLVFSSLIATKLQAQTCNQVEILYEAPDCLQAKNGAAGVSQDRGCKEIGVCVNQPYTYTSSVTGGGWTYNWTVTGPAAVVINPNNTSASINIVWPQVGTYTLTLTATDGAGNVFTYCLKVKVTAKPNANFTFAPNNVCAGSIITFTGTSTYSGSFMSSWNFGDPPSGSSNYNTVSGNTPVTHQYNSPGTYTVTLIVYSFTLTGGGGQPPGPPSIKTCCADTIKKVVTIKPGTLTIECISTVCPGDTVKYTAVGCPNPTWFPVVGGTMLSSTSNTITIIWGNGNPQGQIQAQCPGGCIASVPVPIIPTNPIIIGNTSPCNGSATSYTLPVLPGTFYTWTLTNLTTSANENSLLNTYPDNNTVWINWPANAYLYTYKLTINLVNKHICCSSMGSITITPKQKWTAYYDQTICAGSLASLSANPTAGTFNWNVSPTGGVFPVTLSGPFSFNPVFNNTGTYTVDVTETANTYCNSGLANPQQIQVIVVTTPNPGVINGPATACPGSSYTYNMSPGAPAGYYYTWSIIPSAAGVFQPVPGNPTGNSATIKWTTLPGTISVVLQRNDAPYCPKTVTKTVTQATVGSITGTMNVCVDGNGTYTLTGGSLPPGEPVTWNITPSSQGTIISGQGTNSITVLWHGTTSAGPWPATINASTACGNATPLSGILVYPKFTVSITASGIDICQPGGVSLTVNGAPSGSTIVWSPAIINNITTPGIHTVTVTKGGCSAMATYTVEDPFLIIPVTCGVGTCSGLNTNEQLGVQVIKPVAGTFTYQWYSGIFPGGTIIGPAITANYLAPSSGNYYVVVTYGTGLGVCTKHVSFTVKKVCCPDVNNPQITVVRTGCNSFIFTGTTNPTSATITWNFGNGVTATGVSGQAYPYTYPSTTVPGDYCVTFCVGPPSPNPTNCTGNCATRTVRIPILAAFTYTLGCNGCLNINNSSIVLPISNLSTATYAWNFGDPSSGAANTSALQNPAPHCYLSAGTYTVQLTITYTDPPSGLSCQSIASQQFIYTPLAISVIPSPVCTGVQTTFSITSSPSLTIVSYTWNFGDGFTAYTASTTHIYNSSGPFTVTLTVIDALGNTCTATKQITVVPGISNCTILPAFFCPGFPAILNGPNILGATYSWEIESSPGIWTLAPGTNNAMAYSTTTPGFYHVIVIGPGPNYCRCISNKVEVKALPKPKAIIAVSPSSKLCGPGNVMLTSPNHLTGYTSDWYANGNYGSLLFSGQYYSTNVSTTTIFNLILTNEYGCKDTCSLTVIVNPIPPGPVITSSPTLCEGVPITLTVTNYANNITWNTGNNTTSITVTVAGVYTATYTDPATGCSSSSSITIKRRPVLDLFPHFCDSIPCTCRDSTGGFTIYAPKPLIGAFASSYNIQWYFNGNPVGSNGNNPTYSPAVTGTYYIVVTDLSTGCTATSNTYSIVVLPCDSCNCKESKWGDITLTKGDHPAGKAALVAANPTKLNCDKTYKLDCNKPFTINASYICKDTACPGKVTYSLQPPTGGPITGNIPPAFTFTPTLNGTYTLTLFGWCGDTICSKCIIKFDVKCDSCDCKGSHWGNKTYTIDNVSQPVICTIPFVPIVIKCNKTVTVNANYICADTACNSAVTYKLVQPSGTTTGSMPPPLIFNTSLSGLYILTLYGWCGGKVCDTCRFQFRVDSCDHPCCPYNITVKDTTIQLSTISNPSATVANGSFSISGPTGNLFTEIRAEVMSYNLFSNYNNECLNCKSYPFTWASIYKAGNVGTIPPRITMYNSTASSFNPAGNGMYQNPREVVWTGSPPFALPNNINIQFLLPPASIIDCCDLTAKICVKFTFRDKDCKECEVIVCFTVKIKK